MQHANTFSLKHTCARSHKSSLTENEQINYNVAIQRTASQLCQVVRECLVAVGVGERSAAIVAENLVMADSRGIPSHGVNRLEM